jgi:HEAT repeat protein
MPLIRSGRGAPPPSDGRAENAEQALRSGTSDERWAAARVLSGQPQAVGSLAAALEAESDPRVREALLTGLARIGSPESAEPILPLVRSDDAGLRAAALDALRLMPLALETHLAVLLRDPDPDVRVLACDLARALPAQTATALLCDLLAREPLTNACAAAVDVLAECGGPECLPALEACAARFAEEPFLVFSLKVAQERIRTQAPTRDG